jgi:hypothetical protein
VVLSSAPFARKADSGGAATAAAAGAENADLSQWDGWRVHVRSVRRDIGVIVLRRKRARALLIVTRSSKY